MAKAGRKRSEGLREASGRLSRAEAKASAVVVPLAALARRAEACGVDVKDVLIKGDIRKGLNKTGEAVVTMLCTETGGLALERLAWQIKGDGTKVRRVMVMDGRPVEWITDNMLAAAEAYKTLWIEWYRTTGLPRRHPQPGQIGERTDKAHEAYFEPSPKRMSMIRDWLDKAEKALDGCEPRRLVWAAIDTVVIDNEVPIGLEYGERSAALHALRDGLAALEVLVGGKGKRKAWFFNADEYGERE